MNAIKDRAHTAMTAQMVAGRVPAPLAQGASWLTERKEYEIGGLARMRFTQLKSWRAARYCARVLVCDFLSGDGMNVVSGRDDPIDGSPLRLLSALSEAVETKKGPNPMALAGKAIEFFFSDIRPDAIARLNQVIADRGPLPCKARVHTAALEAAAAIRMLAQELLTHSATHVILVLDPNGPKAFPRDEVLELLLRFGDRVDVIPYISATAINRCLRHKQQCGVEYDWWLSSIERLDSGFVLEIAKNRRGWIREPIPGDPQQWMMIPTFPARFAPRNDWAKQGYVEIYGERGLAALRRYSHIKGAA